MTFRLAYCILPSRIMFYASLGTSGLAIKLIQWNATLCKTVSQRRPGSLTNRAEYTRQGLSLHHTHFSALPASPGNRTIHPCFPLLYLEPCPPLLRSEIHFRTTCQPASNPRCDLGSRFLWWEASTPAAVKPSLGNTLTTINSSS